MGSWFSNLHIRKNETVNIEAAADWLRRHLAGRGYLAAASEEADGAVALIDGENWVTVCSDILSLEDPGILKELAEPLSGDLRTDVLGIACFDSDYLYLNLLNRAENVNAWVGIGSAAGLGIRRRTGLAAWKKKVRDFEAFSACVKEKYVCAEEFLFAVSDCLNLSAEHGGASYEYLQDLGLDKKARILYFKLPEDQKPKEPPRLEQFMSDLTPAQIGRSMCVTAINRGGESRGLSVYFLGPYVEREEITFTGVEFVQWKGCDTKCTPFELTKVRLTDGQWAYYYHDPGFRIPSKVDERLPFTKQMNMMREREIIVRFIPQGNPRKTLDITVIIQPDKNPEGQTGWNVWHRWGSKEAFIDWHNEDQRAWKERTPPEYWQDKSLNREDFD